MLFKLIPLRTRRTLSLYKVYGDNNLLVHNGTPFYSDNVLLALSRLLYNFGCLCDFVTILTETEKLILAVSIPIAVSLITFIVIMMYWQNKRRRKANMSRKRTMEYGQHSRGSEEQLDAGHQYFRSVPHFGHRDSTNVGNSRVMDGQLMTEQVHITHIHKQTNKQTQVIFRCSSMFANHFATARGLVADQLSPFSRTILYAGMSIHW